MTNVAIIDLDGTIALHQNRKWSEYDLLHTDAVCPSVLALAVGLATSGVDVIFLTGRPDLYEKETAAWLKTAMPPDVDYNLICRPAGDRRSNAEFKREAVAAIRENGAIITLAVEDYDKTARMFHRLGIPTMYVMRETTEPFLITDEDRNAIDLVTTDRPVTLDGYNEACAHLRKRAGLA